VNSGMERDRERVTVIIERERSSIESEVNVAEQELDGDLESELIDFCCELFGVYINIVRVGCCTDIVTMS